MMRHIFGGLVAMGSLAALTACVIPGATPVLPQASAETSATRGAADFQTLCAPCHGPTAKGDGELANGLAHRPADLTGLSARNGGTFPMPYVMHKIWGYAKGGAPSAIMPQFGPLMDSRTVLFDAGDGIQTPTPERLVDLANYLTTIQGK